MCLVGGYLFTRKYFGVTTNIRRNCPRLHMWCNLLNTCSKKDIL